MFFRSRAQEAPNTSTGSETRKRPWYVWLVSALPLLATCTALVLMFLCIYAGDKPDYMQDDSIFSVNMSRIGENMLAKLDSKISDIQINLKKRAEFVNAPVLVTRTAPAPTTLITMAPRDIFSSIESLGSEATSKIDHGASDVTSKVGGEYSSATAKIHSAVTSAEGAAETAINGELSDVEQKIIAVVNEAYHALIADFNLSDFYNVHVKTTCAGTYEFKSDGIEQNITVGASSAPPPNTTVHDHVQQCSSHSAIDPLNAIEWVYWTGAAFTIAAVVPSLLALLKGPQKKFYPLIALLLLLPALGLIALASAIVQGVALTAVHVVNFIGGEIGIAAYQGGKFLALSWAATGLVFASVVLWVLLVCFGGALMELGGRLGDDDEMEMKKWRGG